MAENGFNLLIFKKLARMKIVRALGKRKLFFTALFLFLGMIFSPTLRYYVTNVVEFPIHYREYREFGIRLPNYEVHGIDVSRWQDRMDWERVGKMRVGDTKLEFCFIKATEGGFKKDREFDRNWAAARKNGLIRGAYHFFKPAHSASLQSWNFRRVVALKKGDLPPVCDIEESGGMNKADLVKNVKLWLDAVQSTYGVRPILYSNKDFYLKYFYKDPDFANYILWIANYRVNNLVMPKEVEWSFWQHSDAGNVNGTNENVDFNVFVGSSEDLQKLCL
jgi:lysozyme